jgi:hypothetical protein
MPRLRQHTTAPHEALPFPPRLMTDTKKYYPAYAIYLE